MLPAMARAPLEMSRPYALCRSRTRCSWRLLWPRGAGQQLDLARKRVGLLLRQRANESPQRNSAARGTIELQRRRRRKTSVNHRDGLILAYSTNWYCPIWAPRRRSPRA
jgi:hypothetical protein